MMAPRLARWGCALPMSMVSLDSRTLDLHGRMDSYLSTAETQHGLGYHIVDVNMDVHFTGLFRVCPSLISLTILKQGLTSFLPGVVVLPTLIYSLPRIHQDFNLPALSSPLHHCMGQESFVCRAGNRHHIKALGHLRNSYCLRTATSVLGPKHQGRG